MDKFLILGPPDHNQNFRDPSHSPAGGLHTFLDFEEIMWKIWRKYVENMKKYYALLYVGQKNSHLYTLRALAPPPAQAFRFRKFKKYEGKMKKICRKKNEENMQEKKWRNKGIYAPLYMSRGTMHLPAVEREFENSGFRTYSREKTWNMSKKKVKRFISCSFPS